jgi:hypothetical protein
VDKRATSKTGHAADDCEPPDEDPDREACDQSVIQEVNVRMPNPLAIGVTIGGLLLDIFVPRPKPRSGLVAETSLLSDTAGSRTPLPVAEVHEVRPVAGG